MLHDNLRVFRAYCELSQEQVAEILGIDPDTYRKYEIGTAIPSEEEIETLANIYNVSPDRLTGEFDIMKFINLRQSIDFIGSYFMCKSCYFCNFRHVYLHIFALCHEIFGFIPKGSNKKYCLYLAAEFFKNHK